MSSSSNQGRVLSSLMQKLLAHTCERGFTNAVATDNQLFFYLTTKSFNLARLFFFISFTISCTVNIFLLATRIFLWRPDFIKFVSPAYETVKRNLTKFSKKYRISIIAVLKEGFNETGFVFKDLKILC